MANSESSQGEYKIDGEYKIELNKDFPQRFIYKNINDEVNQDLKALSRYMGTSSETYPFTEITEVPEENTELTKERIKYLNSFKEDQKIDLAAQHITNVLWGCGDQLFDNTFDISNDQFARIAFVIARNHDLMLDGIHDSFVDITYNKLLESFKDEDAYKNINEQYEIVTGKELKGIDAKPNLRLPVVSIKAQPRLECNWREQMPPNIRAEVAGGKNKKDKK